MHYISLHLASICFLKHCPYQTMIGFFIKQGDQEYRQVSDSITFQSQGKFILLVSLDCTDFGNFLQSVEFKL
jgi:hypothetical protein